MLPRRPLLALLCLALIGAQAAQATESRCYGTVAKGRLESGVKLPTDGANFSAYSKLAGAAGRTYVHAKVADVIVASYATLQARTPGVHYVYGETGWAAGGSFKPHRTHQNGLSVDFFVPVRDAQGRSMPLPTATLTRFRLRPGVRRQRPARRTPHRLPGPGRASVRAAQCRPGARCGHRPGDLRHRLPAGPVRDAARPLSAPASALHEEQALGAP